jgi:hypothetical protein
VRRKETAVADENAEGDGCAHGRVSESGWRVGRSPGGAGDGRPRENSNTVHFAGKHWIVNVTDPAGF